MKKILVITAVCVFAPFCARAAQQRELGLIVGEPTGVSAKMDLRDGSAVDAALAWSFSGKDRLSFHADKLWHKNDVFSPEEGRLPLYYGLGARIKLEDKSVLGARFPVGLQYYFKDVRFTAFGELAPILDLLPDTAFRLGAAIGFRVVF